MEGLASLRTKLNGQEHSLAWINRNEAQALKDMGGSGKPGPMGIPAYSENDSENDADSTDSGTGGANSEGGSGGSSGSSGGSSGSSGGSSGGSGTSGTSEGNEGISYGGLDASTMGGPQGFDYSVEKDGKTGDLESDYQEEMYDMYQYDILDRDTVEDLLGFSLDDPYKGFRDMHDFTTVRDIQR